MKNTFYIFTLIFWLLTSHLFAQTFTEYQILKAQQITQQFTELMTLYAKNPKEFRADKDLQNLFENRENLIYNDLDENSKDVALYAYILEIMTSELSYQMSFADTPTPYKVYAYKEKYMGIDLQKTIKYENISKKLELTVIIKPEIWKIAQISLKSSAQNTVFVEEDVFSTVEEPATPIGGYPVFYSYIQNSLNYPVEAKRMNITGKVYVQFVVDIDGSLTDIKVLKGIGGGCDEECIRVISQAPRWNASKNLGKYVKQRIVMPITFSLSGKGKK